MQVLLGILFFLLGLFLCVGLFVLVCPCYYFFEGNKQENFWGVLAIHIGFFKLRLCIENNGDNWHEFYVLGRKIVGVQKLTGKRRKVNFLSKKKIFQKKKEKVEKQRRWFFSRTELFVWRELLEQETFSLLVKLCKKAWSKIRPKNLFFKGKVGFSDPYYTGLLAAVFYGVTRENIVLEPDFSQPICEFTLQIEGQIYLIVLIYYSLRFLLIYPLRSIVWGKSKWC
jgi:hypothetical protein